MNSKILKFVLIGVFSICLSNTANAGLIVGDLYADENGIQWEYVGSFDLSLGPYHQGDAIPDTSPEEYMHNTTPYNGIEAAFAAYDAGVLIGGPLSVSDVIALSSNDVTDYSDISDFLVNHKAWYDAFDDAGSLHEAGESIVANKAGGASYDANGDVSAFIHDRAVRPEDRIEPGQDVYYNHVFKSTAAPEPPVLTVPEPSSLAILSIALFGLLFRRSRSN